MEYSESFTTFFLSRLVGILHMTMFRLPSDKRLRARLQELIAALDRRRPHPGREAEGAIAADAAALKQQAQDHLNSLDAASTAKECL